MTALLKRKNFAVATVSTGYAAGDTSIVLQSGHGSLLPSGGGSGFLLTWWNATDYTFPDDDPNVERVLVTARSVDTLTVTRAQDSTSASSKNTADKTYKMMLAWGAGEIDDLETKIQNGLMNYAADGGSANTYTATLDPAISAYAAGMVVRFKAANANTGASTLNVNGVSATALVRKNGEALVAGDIRANDIVEAVYNGTNWRMTSSWVEGKQVARAWASWDSSSTTPTLTDSYNVASLTDNGVGDVTVNIADDFADTTYAVAQSAGNNDVVNVCDMHLWGASAKLAGSCRMRTWNNVAALDAVYNHVIFFGSR